MSQYRLSSREKRMTWAIALLVGIILVPPISWIVDRRLPRQVEVEASPVHIGPGESLHLEFHIVAREWCASDIDEKIVDAAAHVWPVERPAGNPSAFKVGQPFSRAIDVPTVETASPGQATYSQDVTYACNPVQRWLWPLRVHRAATFVFDKPPTLESRIRRLLNEEVAP